MDSWAWHGLQPLGIRLCEDSDEERQAQEKIQKALKGTFRPEFLNRIDEIIMFSPLTIEDMREIVVLQMKEIQTRLKENGLKVELTPAAQEWLAQIGYDQTFGARPLRRALQKHVESPLSLRLLSGEFVSGDVIQVDVDEKQEIVFRKSSSVPLEQTEGAEVSV